MLNVNKYRDSNSMQLSVNNIHQYISLLNTDLIKENITIKTIAPAIALAYKGDFYGLLHNEFGLPNYAYYLHLIINGFNSSIDYDGERDIKLLKPDAYETIYDLFKQYGFVK